jgi:uncharacterized protein (TIGR00297 family)
VVSGAARAAPLSRGEVARKLVHMGVGLIAFSLRFLGPLWGGFCALVAVVFNLVLLPRIGGRRLWREADAARGMATGIVLYPVAVLLLILLFHRRLEVAAAVWGILAFGDGMASLVGMTFGHRKLPWNPAKSWAGSAAYLVFGAAAATLLLLWTAPARYPVGFALGACLAAALFAALLESLPHGLDDNLGVPLVTGLLLFCLLLTAGGWEPLLAGGELGRGLAVGAAANLLLGALAYAAGGVSRSGLAAGLVVGTVVWGFLGWRGFLLLLAFFVLGTAATRAGHDRKAAAGIAEGGGGRRGARNVLAKSGVPALCAVFAATTPFPVPFVLAFAGALATAAADTASSEIGQAWGRQTFLVTTLRGVPPGTEGAISVEGTVAGVLAAMAVALVGRASGLLPGWGIPVVVVAAFLATTLESFLGATLERQGLLDKEAVNFLNLLAGALIAAAGATFAF